MTTAPAVPRLPVTSKLLTSIGYDPTARELHIEFARNGQVYVYHGVSPEQHAALLAAESTGSHFLQHIKPHHEFRRI